MLIPAIAAFAAVLNAGQVAVSVVDAKGAPVEGAVAYVVQAKGVFPAPKQPYVMDQIDLEFAPPLLPILVGGRVSFPNKDNVRHELYSFSPAKKFELPLYKGKPAQPIRFDKPGVVKLGCNIHDWMSGVILVLQNPYFAKTDKDGKAVIKGAPAGAKIAVYHPRLKGEPEKLAQAASAQLQFTVELRPEVKKKRPAANPYGGSYGGSSEP